MKEFFSSPLFLLIALSITAVFVVVVIFWRNTSWTPRGVTPDGAGRVLNSFLPESKMARWAIFGFIASIPIFVLVSLIWQKFGSASLKSPSFESISSFACGYWLWILILVGITSAIIYINKDTLGNAAGVLQTALVAILIGLFVISPIAGWITSPSKDHAAASKPAAWTKIVLPPGCRSETIPIHAEKRVIAEGDGFRLVNVYPDGSECSSGGNCPPFASGVYFRNETDKEVVVSFQKK